MALTLQPIDWDYSDVVWPCSQQQHPPSSIATAASSTATSATYPARGATPGQRHNDAVVPAPLRTGSRIPSVGVCQHPCHGLAPTSRSSWSSDTL
uniref:Uncharacterized protein n=1 Tax=Arundo donax TaxID=35708 RepID=A0A0A9B3I7_ARUDO